LLDLIGQAGQMERQPVEYLSFSSIGCRIVDQFALGSLLIEAFPGELENPSCGWLSGLRDHFISTVGPRNGLRLAV
jgi:hypothetical protein